MKRIETHLSQTPLRDTARAENFYSVGVLHVTRAEAEEIIDFAQRLERQRREAEDGSSQFLFLCPVGHVRVTKTSVCARCVEIEERRKFLANRWAADGEPEVKQEPRNRFSGLDIP